MHEFIVAHNPDPRSRLPYVVCLPLGTGSLWLKAAADWPRTARVYCHPLEIPPQIDQLQILQRTTATVCARRGSAIDLVLSRGINKRSQFVFVAQGARTLIFWQTPKTARATKLGMRIPTGRASDVPVFYVDSRERYAYAFPTHRPTIVRRALPVGDYAVMDDERYLAVVERKAMGDFTTSLVDGSLSFAMAELSAVALAAVVVEGTYSQALRHAHTRAGLIPALTARLCVRYPHVSIHFLESRKVAEEWSYRFLCAAHANAQMFLGIG